MIYTLLSVVRRLDNGRRVRIVDVQPNGLQVFYRTEDLQDGHTCILSGAQLRPDSGGKADA